MENLPTRIALTFICLSLFTTLLFAEEEKKPSSPHKFTGSVGFLSDYISRGISQSFRQPSITGELKYVHRSGVYFKTDGFSVDGTGNFLNNTSFEWDFFLGFKHQLFKSDFNYDVGFLYYFYPGGKSKVPSNTRYDTVEYYIALDYKELELKLSLTLTDFFGNNSSNPPTNWDTGRRVSPNGHSYGSPYLEANYEWAFHRRWKANFHLGYQGVVNYPELGYVDWFITVSRSFKWFDVSLAYVQATSRDAFYKVPNNAYHPHRVNLGGPTAVLGVARSF